MYVTCANILEIHIIDYLNLYLLYYYFLSLEKLLFQFEFLNKSGLDLY